MRVNDLVKRCHEQSRVKGFWEGEDNNNLAVKIALIHSELSEALEELRFGSREEYYHHTNGTSFERTPSGQKPEGFPVELADAVIRCFDLAGYCGIDLEDIIDRKLRYNMTRVHRHGRKF